jgi:hydrogenase-4 component B
MAEINHIPALWPLAGAAVTLLAAGVFGYLNRVMTWTRLDQRQARTLAMRGSLTATTLAAAGVVAFAVARLSGCRSAAAVPDCAGTIRLLAISAPVPELPRLDLAVRVDGLSAVFLLVVAFCGLCVAVYSFGFLRGNVLRNHVAGSYALFLLTTMMTLVVDNLFWVFIALELMTITSADLVRYRGRIGGPVQASRTAVRTYLFVSHIGLMCLVAGVLPIAVYRHSLGLDVLRTAGGSPVPVVSFILILFGLLIRSGVTPFHFWVPIVHPQLPTNTHAMMSAVMLKIPTYLMIRFFL